MLAKRIHDYTTRHPENPLKTNAQPQSQSRIPLAAVLYSRRVIDVFHSRSALRPTARRSIEQQNISAFQHRPTALRFNSCSPNSQSAARPSRHRLRSPAHPPDLRLIVCQLVDLKVNNRFVRVKLFVVSNASSMHSSTQLRPIVHNHHPTIGVTHAAPAARP
jgi:hypothetical protein